MDEEFESAVFQRLGLKALLGGTMSLHEAFKKGWQAARELDAKRITELEDEIASLIHDNTMYITSANEAANTIVQLEAQNKAMREALVMWDKTIYYQYSGSREAMSYLQECANETVRLIGKED